MSRARRYVRHYADAVIAINHYSASMFPECRTKMQIIYDWIDIEKRYEKRSFSDIFGVDSENLKVLLFTGGLGRIKGTYEVVKTFTDEIQGAEYRLLMMGSGLDYRLQGVCGKIKKIMMITGWKPYGYRVMEQIKKDDRIICISPTYNMVDFYRQAYCTLSYFTIPHANLALAEAVSLGTVAIAAMTEEALEYTNNGRGAVLFNINDKDDFSAKIRYVLANYENVKEKTLQNSSAVRKRFSPDRNIRKLNQVCEDVSYNGNTLQNKRIN